MNKQTLYIKFAYVLRNCLVVLFSNFIADAVCEKHFLYFVMALIDYLRLGFYIHDTSKSLDKSRQEKPHKHNFYKRVSSIRIFTVSQFYSCTTSI